MGLNTYTIERFIGLNQSFDENRLSPVYSPDAANFDTTDGFLKVADGFSRYLTAIIPGAESIDAIAVHRSTDGEETPIIITGNKIYASKNDKWTLIHDYGRAQSRYACQTARVRIDTTDYLLIADGAHRLLKYDGNEVTEFGSEEGSSNIPVSYIALYRGRLFAAGDRKNPDRLYYSCLPGSGRTIENWGYIEASPAVEGGHAEVGSVGGDPIVAICALSNQLLIFKKNSLYRLIGDRPSNFTIEHIDASIRSTVSTGIAAYGDMLYFVTADGLYYYNGVTARPCPDMKMIKNIMANADVSNTQAAIVKDKLYFTLKHEGKEFDSMIEYDLIEHKYMLRDGFTVSCLAANGDELLFANSQRYVYIWGVGSAYDDQPIEAHWTTPLTDLGDKSAIKSMHEIFIRGCGAPLLLETETDTVQTYYRMLLPEGRNEVVELPLINEGRCIRLRFSNEAGGHFTLEGGVELCLGIRRRTD